jgi:hypothetical protein
MTYDIGDRVRLAATFQDLNSNLADPTTITLTIKKPNQPAVVYAYALSPALLIRDSVGRYHVDLDLHIAGTWKYKWNGGGAIIAAEEGRIFVRPNNVR